MAKVSNEDTIALTDVQLATIRETFNKYDEKRQGYISTQELGGVMRSLGHNLDSRQLRDLVRHVDTDNNGTIEFDEFLPLMAAKIKEKEEQDFYKNLFRMLDKKNRGSIRCEDLRYILTGMAKEVDLSEREIDNMIAEVDSDGNGEVSFEEFYTLMTTE